MRYKIAGIDMHKKVLVVVVADREEAELQFDSRQFRTTTSDLSHLVAWLMERNVQEVVTESTAQYWKPVWWEMRPHFRCFLAQAPSNKAAKGRKRDLKDSKRLVRRFICR